MAHETRRGFQVTARDREIVWWIGRQRFVEAGQVARRFGMDRFNAYRRLRGLVMVGLLAYRRVFHGAPGAYWATGAGLAAVGLRLRPAGVDIRTYDHDRLAVDVLVGLEGEFGRELVVTERELRSRDSRTGDPRYGVRRAGQSNGRVGLHFPDLAIESQGGCALAVEVELSAKGRTRLDAIVAAYVRARHIPRVRYYLASAARPGVESAVSRAGANDLFDLRSIEGLR